MLINVLFLLNVLIFILFNMKDSISIFVNRETKLKKKLKELEDESLFLAGEIKKDLFLIRNMKNAIPSAPRNLANEYAVRIDECDKKIIDAEKRTAEIKDYIESIKMELSEINRLNETKNKKVNEKEEKEPKNALDKTIKYILIFTMVSLVVAKIALNPREVMSLIKSSSFSTDKGLFSSWEKRVEGN